MTIQRAVSDMHRYLKIIHKDLPNIIIDINKKTTGKSICEQILTISQFNSKRGLKTIFAPALCLDFVIPWGQPCPAKVNEAVKKISNECFTDYQGWLGLSAILRRIRLEDINVKSMEKQRGEKWSQ